MLDRASDSKVAVKHERTITAKQPTRQQRWEQRKRDTKRRRWKGGPDQLRRWEATIGVVMKHDRASTPGAQRTRAWRERQHKKRKNLLDPERVYAVVLSDSVRDVLVTHPRFKPPESMNDKTRRAAVAEVAAYLVTAAAKKLLPKRARKR
jgi:hypothetical protein